MAAPDRSTPEVVVHADLDALAAAAAARLVGTLAQLQAAGTVPSIVLTGGGTGIAVLEQVRAAQAGVDWGRVDWGRVDIFWGDERFLPPGDPDRNETQARAALLDHVPLDPARVFPMGADTGTGEAGADRAAQEYAQVLARAARQFDVPQFDVLMLGMGEEGHTASVFPDSPAVHETARTVVGVHDCPKPPPTRVSLTLPAIRRAAEVWIMTTGAAKAPAVAAALGGAGEVALPVAGARGTRHTRYLLDRAAAADLPPG